VAIATVAAARGRPVAVAFAQLLLVALPWATAQRQPSALVCHRRCNVLAPVCLVPGLILTLGAARSSGLARGVVLVSAGSVLGASAAFFIAATLAREWTQRRLAAWPRFRALDGALGDRRLLDRAAHTLSAAVSPSTC